MKEWSHWSFVTVAAESKAARVLAIILTRKFT
jgi:hypothetical protein